MHIEEFLLFFYFVLHLLVMR